MGLGNDRRAEHLRCSVPDPLLQPSGRGSSRGAGDLVELQILTAMRFERRLPTYIERAGEGRFRRGDRRNRLAAGFWISFFISPPILPTYA